MSAKAAELVTAPKKPPFPPLPLRFKVFGFDFGFPLRRAVLCSVFNLRSHDVEQQEANLRLINTAEYREGYANSVQIRVSVWDFLLIFGRLQQQTPAEVEIHHFQGIYLSPQQAKALHKILEQNIVQYEKAFGEIKLDSSVQNEGPVN